MLTSWIPQYAKALLGGLIAGLSSAATNLHNGGAFTTADYLYAVIAGLVTFSGIAVIPNKPKQ